MVNKSAESKRDKTIRRILNAAAKIFSEAGFAGARKTCFRKDLCRSVKYAADCFIPFRFC